MSKGEIAHFEQFLLFPQSFLTFRETPRHYHQIWNCRLQTHSVWQSLKFVIWERDNVVNYQMVSNQCLHKLDTLLNNKILDLSKLKTFADYK